jgi:3-oxoacyl-[acyl-carrier protein] reductase
VLGIDLSGRVALITGAARGLGRADALALAQAGCDLVLTDVVVWDAEDRARAEALGPLSQVMEAQGVNRLAQTAEECRAAGVRVRTERMDVTDPEEVGRVVASTLGAWGRIDILVNNAGTLDHLGQLTAQQDPLWERDLRVNLTGAYRVTKTVWPHMQARRDGRVVFVSSVAGTMGGFGQASYASTKAGLLGLMRTLALEGARHGIRVNAVVPGVIGSEAGQMIQPALRERMVSRTALRRDGTPQEVAHAIAFLVSDLASYVTGVALPVAGGIDLFTF